MPADRLLITYPTSWTTRAHAAAERWSKRRQARTDAQELAAWHRAWVVAMCAALAMCTLFVLRAALLPPSGATARDLALACVLALAAFAAGAMRDDVAWQQELRS